MKVLKFGGSSISSSENIKNVCRIISDDSPKIVVLSAIENVTNLLESIVKQLRMGDWIMPEQLLSTVKEIHYDIIDNLFSSSNFKQIAKKKVNNSISVVSKSLNCKLSAKVESSILAQGELLSSMIIYLYLLEIEHDTALIPALGIIKLEKTGDPDYQHISSKLTAEFGKHKGCKLFITQGFIARDYKNNTTNLTRGGSDYTATIIGKAINAESIEIWTDKNGLQNNDPRFVETTETIESLSYDEASELAFFGAKILHPSTLKPIQKSNIPLRIKNTFNSISDGTLIYQNNPTLNLKAVASKDGITTIKLKSAKMMQAFGFLKKVFEVFEKYQTSVDMLTTSEISVAMTIDNRSSLDKIVEELNLLGDVQVENHQSIICIVQNYQMDTNYSIKEIISGLQDIPVKMVSYGASKINFSIIIDTEHKTRALNLLNESILKNELCLVPN